MTTQSERVDAYAETGRYHRPWYWYDWANSAFVTTVGTVLFGPYLTTVAKEAACPGIDSDARCGTDLYVVPAAQDLPRWISTVAFVAVVALLVLLVLGVVAYARDTRVLVRPTALVVPLAVAAVVVVLTAPLDPGSIAPYTVTAATIMSALLLIMVGADRRPVATPRPAPGPVRLGRLGRRGRAVLPRRQQLAVRRGDDDHRLHQPRCQPGRLRRHPVPHREPRRPRQGLQPRLGPGLPRRWPAAGHQPRARHRTRPRRHRHRDGGADQPALGGPVVGGLHDHPRHGPVEPARQRPERDRRAPLRGRAGQPGAARAHLPRPAELPATPCCSCWPTSSSTTASRPSSPRAASTAPSS